MQMQFDFTERESSSWIEEFAPLILVAILLLIIFLNKDSGKQNDEWDELGSVRKLRPEQIRAEPGYENLSDEEVDNIIETNYQLSLICYNHFKSNISTIYLGEY